MARLQTVLACEKVIVDRGGTPSLIALFQQVNISHSEGLEVPRDTITFKEWAVYSEWKPDPQDVGTTSNQIMEVLYPDGSPAPIKGSIPFHFENNAIHRGHQNVVGLPVGQAGVYLIRVWLERDGQQITTAGATEIIVAHSIPQGADSVTTFGQSAVFQNK